MRMLEETGKIPNDRNIDDMMKWFADLRIFGCADLPIILFNYIELITPIHHIKKVKILQIRTFTKLQICTSAIAF